MLYSGQKEEEKKNVLYVVHAASIEEWQEQKANYSSFLSSTPKIQCKHTWE